MKAIFPGFTNVDNSPGNVEQDGAGSGQGFDALLALAAARTPTQAQPVKALAPNLDVMPDAADAALGLMHQAPRAQGIVLPAVQAPEDARVDASASPAHESADAAAPALPAPTSGDAAASRAEDSDVPAGALPASPQPAGQSEPKPASAAAPSSSLRCEPSRADTGGAPAASAPESTPEAATIGAQARGSNQTAPNAAPRAATARDTVAHTEDTSQTRGTLSGETSTGGAPKRPAGARSALVGQAGAFDRGAQRARDKTSATLAAHAPSASEVALQSTLAAQVAPLANPAAPAVVGANTQGTAPAASPARAPSALAVSEMVPAAGEDASPGAEAQSSAGDFAQVLAGPLAGQPAPHAGTNAAGVAPAGAATQASQAVPATGAVDPETGARVVRIAYFSTKASDAPATPLDADQLPPNEAGAQEQVQAAPSASAAPVAKPAAEPAAPERAQEPNVARATEPGAEPRAARVVKEEARAGYADARDAAPSEHDAPERQGEREPPTFAQHAVHARSARHEPEDVRGIRGLDAVVASLLRAGNEHATSDTPRVERVPMAPAPNQMGTDKTSLTKQTEELSAELRTSQRDAALREEERRAREELALPEPHAQHLVDLAPRPDVSAPDTAPEPLPLAPPVPLPDADAAAMGKLARGEGVDGAAISIEHPDLGSMDVIVENENGRIDVRAVLDTPRAAAVLRAHESALRYGIQQAGMTFGALRVRARNGEAPPVKSEGSVKRRRGNEWEA